MSLTDKLARERRGRLAAERMLELKSRELIAANRKLSNHALKLSDQIIEQREVVATTRAQAEALKTEAQAMKSVAAETQADLQRAEQAVDIAERRLWDSVETITDGFAVFDAEDRLVAANSAWMSLFEGLEDMRRGITYMDMLRLLMEEGLVDPGDATSGDWIISMLDRWDQPQIPDATIRLYDGRYLRLHVRRARDGDMVCLCLDITRDMRREGDLAAARDEAQAATRAKSNFLAKMSHELRTPMNGVVGMAELLLDTEVNEEQALFIQTIRNSGEALLEIINDVLDFSRSEADRMELYPEAFDLEAMLVEVVMLSLPSSREKGLHLLLDYGLEIPALFVADPKRLRQVVVNLLGNAIKFTETGHVKIAVTAVPAPNDNGQWGLEIAVEDSGIGIPEKMQAHIFGQFNQVEDAASRKFEGTGLGLAITRQLVELMGGEITLVSAPGKGTTFTLHLSLEAAGGEIEPQSWPKGEEPLVLFATPSADAAALVKRRMAAKSVICEHLPTAEALTARLQSGAQPDLVVITASIGTEAGLELTKQLAEVWPETRRVLIALHGDPVPGGGKAFDKVVQYPCARAEERKIYEGLAHPPLRLKATAPPASRMMQVLAAEDNRTNRLVFEKMLKRLSLNLSFAENGRDAVEKYALLRPDLVFMDISMPQMDGKDATRAIRQLEAEFGWPRVPVVAMTAHALAGDAEDILAAGLDHYLKKPLKRGLIEEQVALHAPADCDPFLEPESPDARAAG